MLPIESAAESCLDTSAAAGAADAPPRRAVDCGLDSDSRFVLFVVMEGCRECEFLEGSVTGDIGCP